METEMLKVPARDDTFPALRRAGKKLPDDIRERVLALGASAIPSLVGILGDLDSPGSEWSPVHAVDLLADLRATEAAEPMVRALVATEWDDVLHDRLIERLPDLGAAVLEPALAELARTEDPDLCHSVCAVLAKLGVRDERVYAALSELFADDETTGAMCLGDYGDPRALPLLEHAIRTFDPNGHGRFSMIGLADLVEAYNQLGGTLPDEVLARVERIRAEWAERFREKWIRPGPAASTKVGRNDSCPCGSGKKYKRCCG